MRLVSVLGELGELGELAEEEGEPPSGDNSPNIESFLAGAGGEEIDFSGSGAWRSLLIAALPCDLVENPNIEFLLVEMLGEETGFSEPGSCGSLLIALSCDLVENKPIACIIDDIFTTAEFNANVH